MNITHKRQPGTRLPLVRCDKMAMKRFRQSAISNGAVILGVNLAPRGPLSKKRGCESKKKHYYS